MITRQLRMIGIAVLVITCGATDADESSSDTPIVLIFRTSEVNDAIESPSDELISFTIAGDSLHEILKRLRADYGYTYAYPPGDLIMRPGPHVYIEPTPAPKAFERLAAAYGLCAIVDNPAMFDLPNLVRIMPCEGVERYREALREVSNVEFPKVRLGVVTEDGNAEGDSGTGARGAVVVEFFDEQAPAHAAGIKIGDVIVSYGGEPVSGGHDLSKMVGQTEPGDTVPIVVVRAARQQIFTVQFPLSSE